jgi:hypothetical protein
MSGESGDVNVTIVSEWKSKLPNLIKDYHPRDIYNMDGSFELIYSKVLSKLESLFLYQWAANIYSSASYFLKPIPA